MAESPAADSADARRETATSIKSLIRTFEHSSSAERIPAGTAASVEDAPSRNTSKSTISSDSLQRESVSSPSAGNSSVQKIVQSFTSMVSAQQGAPADAVGRRADAPMVRQKSFTFGTKNSIVRRPPPPIPTDKSSQDNSPSQTRQEASLVHAASSPLSQSVEQPRTVSPTKVGTSARSPVGRSVSVIKAPLFGAAARAFSPGNSPSALNGKRMTTQIATSTLSDEFNKMNVEEERPIPQIQSKRPPPAPPASGRSSSSLTAPDSPKPTQTQASETTDAASNQIPTTESVGEQAPPAAVVAEPSPPAVEPTAAVAVVVVDEKQISDDLKVVETPAVAPLAQEPSLSEETTVKVEEQTEPMSAIAAAAEAVSEAVKQDAVVAEPSDLPADEHPVPVPVVTVAADDESTSIRETISSESKVSDSIGDSETHSAESGPPSPAKDKKKKSGSKKHPKEEVKEEEKVEKTDSSKKKKRSKTSEGTQETEEPVEVPPRPKRTKSQRLSKGNLKLELAAAVVNSEPTTPESIKAKKSKRSNKKPDVESAPVSPAVTFEGNSSSGKKHRDRVKSQRLSIDPKLVTSDHIQQAEVAEEAPVSPRRHKKSKKTDEQTSSSSRSKVPRSTSTSESTEHVSSSRRTLKKAQSMSSSGESSRKKIDSDAHVDLSPSDSKIRLEPVAEETTGKKDESDHKRKKSGRLSVMLKLPGEATPTTPLEAPKKGLSGRKKRSSRRRVVRSLTTPLAEGEVAEAQDSGSGTEDSDFEHVMPLSARDRTMANPTSDTDSEVDAIKERLAPRRVRSRSERRHGRDMPELTSSSSDSDSESDGEAPVRRPVPSDEPPSRAILSHAHVVDDTDLTTDFEPDGRIHVVIKRRGRPPVGPTITPAINPKVAGSESESLHVKAPIETHDSEDELDIDEGVPSGVSVETQKKKKRRGSAKPVPLVARNSLSQVTIAAGLSDVNFWAEPQTSNLNAIFEEEAKMFAYNQGKEMARKGGQGLAIKAASFNKLVEHLTWPDYNEDDKIYQRIFLSTLDYFTTPLHLLKKLSQRYDVPTPKKADPTFDATVKTPIHLRVCSVLRFWLEHFSSEFSDAFVEKVKEFINTQLNEKTHKPVFDIITNALNNLVANQKQIQERLRPASVADRKSTSKRDLMRKTQSESTLMFFPTQKVCHPIELVQNDEAARQITMVDWRIWSAIRPWEILKAVLNDNTYNASSSPMKELVARFNQISNFVISAILAQKTVKERARLVSKFIKIAKELRQLNNYNSLMAISAGINHTCIARLSQTMAAVPRKDLKTLNRLDRLMSVKKNWKRYRDALSEVEGPCIPYLGLIVADFVFVHEGHPDEIAGLINFSKMKFLYFNCIEMMQTHQNQPYELETQNMQVDGMIYTQQILEPNQIYKRSITLEPVKKGSIPDIAKETFTPIISQPVRNSSKELARETTNPASPASKPK